ncbi:hypothetical protein BC343_23895 [Mucilaginibacter pedocola]|uniref:HNH nuclease domain-containing protein n=1 Tax=Mucilaginibacter pedocola TaxID=1792845 RepID=A0A1S9PI61_9SPHI|nr:hypothetical protein BC343_23895 [Mucilaginibacter pedocola]
MWGYEGRQAISRGVVTPANSKAIILFVTKEKQKSSTPYVDYISDNFLYWEGEEKGLNNNRIINADYYNHPIHLFYRYKHHTDFIYMGEIRLEQHIARTDKPFEFVFNTVLQDEVRTDMVSEPVYNYQERETEKQSLRLSRVGQGKYRVDLLDVWGSCAITDVKVPEILKASHIKPWKDSSNLERLDPFNGLILTPTLDTLFDKGFISFENNGHILMAKELESFSKKLNLSADLKLRKHFDSNNQYLEYHRDIIFLDRYKAPGI